MAFFYSHPVRTAFLLITLAYGIGAAFILGKPFGQRAPRASEQEAL